ncbi:MAG: protein TolQ [Pseudomonadota bacterium]|jgi:biopolymer transport protein TolQ|nr:protein TolQ [Pseudomonadota bacterium]
MQATLDQMSIWSLISHASLLVKCVMLILLAASVVSWYIIIKHGMLLRSQESGWKRFLHAFRSQSDLTSIDTEAEKDSGIVDIYQQGLDEYQHIYQDNTAQSKLSNQDVMESVERRLLISITEQEERLQQNLTFLATVGSVSPYIGLFGTVWGIMHAFIGLSGVEQATLNTVAPGIAEALIATAIGLFAAIPAVVAYNRFSARADKMSTRYYSFANELQGRLTRLMAKNSAIATQQSAPSQHV